MEDLRNFLRGAAFLFVSAFDFDPLREHAEVADHGDASLDDGGDFFGLVEAAFEFDSFGTGFDEFLGVGEGGGGIGVGIDGEVGDEEGVFGTTGGGGGVVEHVVESDVGGVGEAEDDHPEGVANEEEVEAGFVEEAGGGVIVGGEGGDGRMAKADLSGAEELGFR